MPAYIDRMPAGTPGDVSRKAQAVLEPVRLAEDIAFGAPIQLNAEGHGVNIYDDTKPVYGILARPYPTQSASDADNALGGTGQGKAKTVQDALRSGYMTVRLSAAEGTKPVKGTPVKVVFTATGSYGKGDYAVSQGKEIPGCAYMGTADASGNTEIALNI